MAESQEQWEFSFQGKKRFAASGSRDGLILVSSVPEGPQIVPRMKGELTQQDKDRLTSEGIPSECWEDEAKLMKERNLKSGNFLSVIIEDTTYMKKQHALDRIAALFNNTTAQGVIISYIGPGRKDTGDWCFIDGFISFVDISNLYTQFFTDKVLCIDADCCYSGKWVEYCEDFLDKVGVQPCGHSARKKEIKLKLYCSCQPDQIGSSLFYSVRACGNDKNTGMSFVDRNKEVAPEQTTCGADFTKITCNKLPDETCALSPRFTFQDQRNLNRIFLVTGNDRGRPAWHYLLLVDDPETIRTFKEKTQGANAGTQTTALSDYGVVLKSGWGQEPPQEVKNWIEQVKNGLEDLQYTAR